MKLRPCSWFVKSGIANKARSLSLSPALPWDHILSPILNAQAATLGNLSASVRAWLSRGSLTSSLRWPAQREQQVSLLQMTSFPSAISLHLRRFTSGSEFHLLPQEGKAQSLISHMSSLSHDCGKHSKSEEQSSVETWRPWLDYWPSGQLRLICLPSHSEPWTSKTQALESGRVFYLLQACLLYTLNSLESGSRPVVLFQVKWKSQVPVFNMNNRTDKLGQNGFVLCQWVSIKVALPHYQEASGNVWRHLWPIPWGILCEPLVCRQPKILGGGGRGSGQKGEKKVPIVPRIATNLHNQELSSPQMLTRIRLKNPDMNW